MAVASPDFDDIFNTFDPESTGRIPVDNLTNALQACGIDEDTSQNIMQRLGDETVPRDVFTSVVRDAINGSDLDDLEGVECTWPCSTVLHGKGVIDESFMQVMQRYFSKRGETLWQVSSTNKNDEDSELDDDDQMPDTQFRKCLVAKDTSTLKRLYTMIDGAVEDVVETFVEKYPYFSIVSTKDEYTILKFKTGDFYAEHIEVSGLDDDCDGAARRLCIMIFLDDPPSEGGQIHFPYQDLYLTPNKGDVIVFPACPLHPNSITPVVGGGSLTYAFNYLM
jgi:hypothetical protein